MSKTLDEQMSAFLDGELPPGEIDLVLARLDRDAARRATLGRYAMIGECIRTGAAVPAALGVADRVRAALATEMIPVPQARTSRSFNWAGGALAASIAVALVLGVPGLWRLAQQEQPGVQTVPAPGASSRAAGFDALDEINPGARRRLVPQAAARLTDYMMAHGEYASVISRSNFDSRLVSARAERASWQQPEGLPGAR